MLPEMRYIENELLPMLRERAAKHEKSARKQLAQWNGETGTSMKGECPWVWMVNVEHLYYVRDGLDIGDQGLHPHGASYPLLSNLHQWHWH